MMARSRSEYFYLVNILQYLQFAGMGNALNLVVVVREDRGWIQQQPRQPPLLTLAIYTVCSIYSLQMTRRCNESRCDRLVGAGMGTVAAAAPATTVAAS